MYKVIQWATGGVGRTTLRRIIDHPDLQLVGLYTYGTEKVGRDAGEIAKRPMTGVKATNSIDEILALDADVVIHTSRLTLPYAEQNADVERLLASGKNVISVNGFYRPEVQGTAYAAPLLAAAKRGNATLAGFGLNPGFIAERVALLMTGLVAKLDHIECLELADASYNSSPGLVFEVMGFGVDPAAKDITKGPLALMFTELYAETFDQMAAELGTSVKSVEPDHRLTLAPKDMQIAAGTIKKGTVAATDWRWNAVFADGTTMMHSLLWTSDPTLHGEKDATHWQVRLKGRPNVELNFKVEDPDPKAPPSRAGYDATAAILIRGIPEVCAAASGFFRLPTVLPFSARLQAPAKEKSA